MELRVTNLHCRRAGRSVLSNLSFAVAAGEVLLLRGPNGVGKSTLLRVLTGLIPAAGGRIILDGIELGRDADGYVSRLAYAGHLDAFKPQFSVRENLAFWSRLFGGGDVFGALNALDLHSVAERPAHACSAGQKRRLGLARLLLAPRALWLLDEPTVSLDAMAIKDFAGMLTAHRSCGGISVVATHVDLGVSDCRTLTLDAGREEDRARGDPFLDGTWA
jgi:heme exporter protein A